jgi:hypothetical protein
VRVRVGGEVKDGGEGEDENGGLSFGLRVQFRVRIRARVRAMVRVWVRVRC